jgi:hypothetical protein
MLYSEQIAKSMNIATSDNPASAFIMIFNKITLGCEVLHNYYKIWSKSYTLNKKDIERLKKDNGERIITIERMIFIESLSSIEYVSKEFIKSYQNIFGSLSGRIYLINIFDKSRREGILSNEDHDKWNGLIKLRNKIVHNNAISDENYSVDFNSFKLELVNNQMTTGDLNFLPNILDWMLVSYKDWLLKF